MAEEVKKSEDTKMSQDPMDSKESKEHMKDDKKHDDKNNDGKKKKKNFFAGNHVAAVSFSAIIGLIVGLIIGFYFSGPSTPLDATTVPANKLDEVIATYKYDGGDHKITIRQLMESQGDVELFKTTDKDGKEVYRIPSSDAITSYVRNQVLISIADSKGIKVSDQEIFDTLKKSYNVDGQEGLDSLAKQFGTTPEKLKELISEQIKGEKLVKQLMGTDGELPDPPQKPEAAAEGQENKATSEYADYIIKTVGSAWNKDDKKWADENGPYAKALVGDNAFDGEKASYTQANIVYSIAVQQYQEMVAKGQAKAVEEINAAMANTSLTMRTLAQ